MDNLSYFYGIITKKELKEIIYIVLLLSITFKSGISQQKFSPQVFLGFTQGYNFSQVSFKPGEKLNFFPGYTGGIFVTYIFTRQFKRIAI